jgi:hypothetical protein
MAGARWEQTALLAMMFHNNGFNRPIRDPSIFNPYSQRNAQTARPAAKVRMTLKDLQPLLDRATK